jgi:hypothetical protein
MEARAMNLNTSLRAIAKQSRKMLWIAASPAFAGAAAWLLAMTAMPTDAFAQEKEKVTVENPGRFAPDFCDFEITFPERPLTAQKCVPGAGCYTVNSYTMVYDLQTTVDISVTCNPSTKAAYDQYTEGVMRAALAGMVESRNITGHDLNVEEKDGVKSAALTGVGTTGAQEKIYSAQLWIGPNSVFTVQAELIGDAHEKADAQFRDILASIKSKQGKQMERPKTPATPKQNNQ